MLAKHKVLAKLMKEVLGARDVVPEAVENVVDSLIQASLRGVDSHGIRLFPHYCRAVEAGRVNRNPNMQITQNGQSAAVMDADHAFGHHAGAVAMRRAIEMAKVSGVGAVAVKNSTHFGAAAYFGLMAPEAGCIGMAFSNADSLAKVSGARKAFFGPNPICFTAPMAKEEPFCLDMATTVVSWNKVRIHRRDKTALTEGWAYDENGKPTIDPDEARSLEPIGDYKGYGMAMMISVLCTVLSGGAFDADLGPMFPPSLNDRKRKVGHFFMAMDISRFVKVESFKRDIQAMADRLRSMARLSESKEVMVAGDPEKKMCEKRTSDGIPVEETVWPEFLELSSKFEKAVIG